MPGFANSKVHRSQTSKSSEVISIENKYENGGRESTPGGQENTWEAV